MTEWRRQLTLSEFATNKAKNIARGYSLFYLNSSNHPLLPRALLRGDVSTNIEVIHVMADQMKVALEEAEANLSLAQRSASIIVGALFYGTLVV